MLDDLFKSFIVSDKSLCAKAFEKFAAFLSPRCSIFIIQAFNGLQDIKVFQGHVLKYDYKMIQALRSF